jgi:predicted homoserine dehydrogenase-like protein
MGMDSRRRFVQQVAVGLAGSLVSKGSSERLRVGLIGMGDRGTELLHQTRVLPNVEITAFADVVPARLDRAKSTISSAAIGEGQPDPSLCVLLREMEIEDH